jgi:hypothetical protein
VGTNAGVLRIEPNVPQVIALAFSEGKEIESQFPKPDGSPSYQVLFTLVDGRRAFLPQVAAQKIKEAGIMARVPFEICRRQSGQQTRWEVKTQNDDGTDARTPAPPMQTAKSIPVLNPNTNHYEVPVRPIPQAPTPWPVHTPPQQAVIDRKLSEPQPAPVPAMVNRILASYVVAFDVVARLQQVSEERGLGLNFVKEEHIRQIAATAFIESGKAARS